MDCISNSRTSSEAHAHVLLMPYWVQGHIVPFMKLGHTLASRGIKVTLLTTEFLHQRMETTALTKLSSEEQEQVRIVSVPDGLAPDDDRKDDIKVAHSLFRVMPDHLEDLLKKTNEQWDGAKITCVIADCLCGWALETADKMKLNHAVFFTGGPGPLAMIFHLPKLIEDGVIDASDGTMKKKGIMKLLPDLPAASADDLLWRNPGNELNQQSIFQYAMVINRTLKLSEWLLCNWFHELAPSAASLRPKVVPVCPLLSNGKHVGNLWSEDSSSLTWLDAQPSGSVIYAAFGSTTKFSQEQFDELAFSLELVGRPFLLAVRSNATSEAGIRYPDGLKERVANRGKIVEWTSQEEVLAHPSVACFLTHTGWNSVMEAMTMGVPMLCWPYFGDNFYNKTCVCYGWKVGLELKPDESGIITRHELKTKVDELLSDDSIRANTLKFRELAQQNLREGRLSSKHFEEFVTQLML